MIDTLTEEEIAGTACRNTPPDPIMLKADGFDAAILGTVDLPGYGDVLLYDENKCIQILMDRDGMDDIGAREFFEFNVKCSNYGPGTPLFLAPMVKEEVDYLLYPE